MAMTQSAPWGTTWSKAIGVQHTPANGCNSFAVSTIWGYDQKQRNKLDLIWPIVISAFIFLVSAAAATLPKGAWCMCDSEQKVRHFGFNLTMKPDRGSPSAISPVAIPSS